MKTMFCFPSHLDSVKRAFIHLEPETAGDRLALKALLDSYEVMGFGRDPETGDVIHAQVPLRPRDE